MVWFPNQEPRPKAIGHISCYDGLESEIYGVEICDPLRCGGDPPDCHRRRFRVSFNETGEIYWRCHFVTSEVTEYGEEGREEGNREC